MNASPVRNVIVIGSGPAGLTAAIYAARANLSPLVFEGYAAGGQLMTTTEVENFPGFPKGIQGPALMAQFRGQAERFGSELVSKDVSAVDLSERPFRVTAEGVDYFAKALIISTGAQAKLLNLPNEKALMGRGVSTCATCDGAFYKNQEIFLVGGGDSAMEEATFLTRFASKVTVVHRRDFLRASKIMQERALSNPKIAFLWNSAISKLIGESELEALEIENQKSGEKTVFKTMGLFVAIGHTPNTALFKGKLDMDENGYLLTEGKSSHTAIPGVFACGDVQDHVYRQAITAAGSGCSAAIDCERWLEHAD